MKRRLFIRSLWLQGIALPSAYLLSPGARAGGHNLELPDAANHGLRQGMRRGCGRTQTGEEVKKHGLIARDFYDPYLELIRLLREAAEIEHALMLQYLFAAYTLRPKYRSLVGPPVPSSDGLLGIAIEEMQHLATVNRLLVELGVAPNLDRQDFPNEPDIYPFPFSLERMTRTTVAKYTYVEAGRESETPQILCDRLTAELGSDTGMNRVAGLYELVLNQIDATDEAGKLNLADKEIWIEKLRDIMIEGERRHFEFFSKVFMSEHPALQGDTDPWDLDPNDPDYPSFPVEPNPSAYFGHDNLILSPEARALAWLSDLHYWLVLMLLDYYYRTGSEAINAMAQAQMVGPLQSLAETLAKRGVGLPFDVLSMGYSPGHDNAGNLQFILRMIDESEVFANKLEPILPDSYPLPIHGATRQLIEAELRNQ